MSVDNCAELDTAPTKIPLKFVAVMSPLALMFPLAVMCPLALTLILDTSIPALVVSNFLLPA